MWQLCKDKMLAVPPGETRLGYHTHQVTDEVGRHLPVILLTNATRDLGPPDVLQQFTVAKVIDCQLAIEQDPFLRHRFACHGSVV